MGCLSWGYSRGGDGSADSLTPAGVCGGWKGGHLAGFFCVCARAGVYVCAFGGELPGVSLAR